eukprot:CAMPEP_0118638288 /NCGR_PEP_ID=MMETSP0785-20121206/3597_1 /TAXON_ID=91992 /ORGANISM="Bolidomonas pacifica, Strain CCMP 1866" /LENGTH=145 /DNA_ID=CAMNT_0006529513 /DNA_START=1183 /DNA_END=1620 /DNA_ORIENTATION=-
MKSLLNNGSVLAVLRLVGWSVYAGSPPGAITSDSSSFVGLNARTDPPASSDPCLLPILVAVKLSSSVPLSTASNSVPSSRSIGTLAYLDTDGFITLKATCLLLGTSSPLNAWSITSLPAMHLMALASYSFLSPFKLLFVTLTSSM